MPNILKGANTNDDMQKFMYNMYEYVCMYIYHKRLDKLIRFDLGLLGCKQDYYMYVHTCLFYYVHI